MPLVHRGPVMPYVRLRWQPRSIFDLPGVPASHGCIRMPYWKARQFYNVAHIRTPVVVKP